MNGHEWAKQQARKLGLGFAELSGGFASCDDAALLQRICDRHRPAATPGTGGELQHGRTISRRLPAWLYRQDQIRDLISRQRALEPPAAQVTAQRASTSSLRQRLDAARAEITRLRAENRSLHDQLARQLGLHRTQHAKDTPGEPA